MPTAKGSWHDLARVLKLLSEKRDIKTWTYCLPIFYANLDPAGIPIGELEGMDTSAVDRAVLILGTLRLLKRSHASAGMDLWPRIWQWTVFLHTHRDCIRPLHPEQNVSVDLLFFIDCLCKDPDTAALISETIGVRAALMHAWISLFDREEGESRAGFSHLCNLLRTFMSPDEPRNLAEILDATDGPSGLGALVVKYIQLFMPIQRTAIQETTIFLYDGMVSFLLEAAECAEHDISPALVSEGIVGPFTSVIRATSESASVHQNLDDFLLDCFQVLANLFMVPGSHKAIADSIAAGLLHAIVRSSVICDGAEDLESTALWELLDIRLLDATVYPAVLAQLKSRLPEVQQFTNLPAFQEFVHVRELGILFADCCGTH
ncbi:hypothetical protein B0H19DRAFT_158747 [Mycena capillaripes]|nr:hypothetical protein B0H19DRAFT_158747 [Mycena capillaripes]